MVRKEKDKPYFNLMWHVADDVLDWVSYYFSFELKNKQKKTQICWNYYYYCFNNSPRDR